MDKRVAIIHDWLNGMRGGEKVLEVMLDLYPQADVFTLFFEPDRISDKIKAHNIFTSRLNRFRSLRNKYRHLLPLFPATIEDFDLQSYQLVISSSHCVAKGVIPPPEAPHISYIHSPMRYIWDQYYAYFGRLGGLKKSFIRRQLSRLRTWDVASAGRVDHFVANSDFVRERIWKYYRREADVIHPPIDTQFFHPIDDPSKDYFLTVSALVPYKMNHLLVEAFSSMGVRLIVVGRGTEEKKLRRMAGTSVEFRRDLSDGELQALYQNARALVFAGIEDFGMSFVEAQACGVPVIAYGRGGILDIIEDGRTGLLFPEQSVQGVCDALARFREIERDSEQPFAAADLRENSFRFSIDNFKTRFKQFVEGRQ
jgi:glycosyltransferase involved in cell wall biosynthesis